MDSTSLLHIILIYIYDRYQESLIVMIVFENIIVLCSQFELHNEMILKGSFGTNDLLHFESPDPFLHSL